jgi:hypothetical protein
MSYKVLQLSPQPSTHVTRRVMVRDSWNAPPPSVPDMGFLRTRFEYDSDPDEGSAYGRTRWGAVSGLALSLAVSAGFWAGVALIVARVWK